VKQFVFTAQPAATTKCSLGYPLDLLSGCLVELPPYNFEAWPRVQVLQFGLGSLFRCGRAEGRTLARGDAADEA